MFWDFIILRLDVEQSANEYAYVIMATKKNLDCCSWSIDDSYDFMVWRKGAR